MRKIPDRFRLRRRPVARRLRPPPPPAAAAPPARPPIRSAQLRPQVNIPYETFTLANGLRVVVHEDRKAPVVAVSIWYNVGSKDEPAGKTGFAHLFEHLMFNGSENAPGEYFEPLRADRRDRLQRHDLVRPHQLFPDRAAPGARARALFLESDRMGHLLGAVTQEKLDNQIGVVQNEKRQGDNQPYGLVEYAQLEGAVPRRPSLSPLDDRLDGRSRRGDAWTTCSDWFRDNYGPNNAVLVLAGDIDAAEARPLVERYFGDIPRGPVNDAGRRPTCRRCRRRVDRSMNDRVANTRLYRDWAVPGARPPTIRCRSRSPPRCSAASPARGSTTAWSAASRPRSRVTRQRPAVPADQHVRGPGRREAGRGCRRGVARGSTQIIADFIRQRPDRGRGAPRGDARRSPAAIQGLEQVGGFGGKAVALAEGMLYADDPDFYRTPARAATPRSRPAQVRAAMQRWLTRPVYALRVDPGEREAYEEAPGVDRRPRQRRRGSRAEPAAALLRAAASRASSRSRRSRLRRARSDAAASARSRRSISRTSSAPACRTASRSSTPAAPPCR